MSRALSISALNTVEVGATTDQTKADIDSLGINGVNKNWIINGGFDIWQRSTSAAQPNGGFVADRWKGNNYVNGTFTFSKRTDATGQTFKTYGRLAQSSAGSQGARQGLMQYIEGNYLVGKTITVSFKARANAALNGCIVRGIIANQTFNLTTSFVKHSFTATAIADGANTRLTFDFGLENTTWHVDIAEVQVEVGSVATDFEHLTYAENLLACQRYYYKYDHSGLSDAVYLTSPYSAASHDGSLPNSSQSGAYWLPVPMRANPTCTATLSAGSASRVTSNGRVVVVQQSSSTANQAIYATIVTADAEL